MGDSILLPVTLDSANRKKDKSVALKFTTNFEITTPDFAQIDLLVQSIGWLKYRDNKVPEEMPKEDAAGKEGKSKLQRLRAVHYLYWRDHTDQSELFNGWWDRKFEQLLDKYKERLD